MRFFDYLPVEDWKILDQKDLHFFNVDETILRALCVEIGEMSTVATDSSITKTPIIRWITEGEYNSLRSKSGVVIF